MPELDPLAEEMRAALSRSRRDDTVTSPPSAAPLEAPTEPIELPPRAPGWPSPGALPPQEFANPSEQQQRRQPRPQQAQAPENPGPDTPPEFALSLQSAEGASPLPGSLSAPGVIVPALPAELASALNPTGLRLAYLLVAGRTWAQALDEAEIPPRAALRDAAPPPPIRAAAEWLVQQIAISCGVSRAWITLQSVALYRRAVQAEEVLDRRGRSTGVFRFDGNTAARMLEFLGGDIGFGNKGKGAIPVSDVAQLLVEIGRRGKPQLDEDRARTVASVPAGGARPGLPDRPRDDAPAPAAGGPFRRSAA